MIAVFDTNVLIAALITEGICSKLLGRARRRQFTLAVCPFILHEIEKVLSTKFFASNREVSSAIALIREASAILVEPKMSVSGICKDKDDDNILACALAAEADYLVTGDAELQKIRHFRKIKIVSPREFELLF